jgi:DNA-binding CsgD family transcriptional regulator
VAVTSIRIFKAGSMEQLLISKDKIIEISSKDQPIFIDFASLSYVEPKKNLYAYKLESLHKDWIHLGNKHSISFSDLDPGKYIFRIKGSNNDGVWNEEGLSITFQVIPSIWQTWWFKAILISILLYIIYRQRIKYITKKLERESKLNLFYFNYKISEREQDVVRLLLRGKSNREIEHELYISVYTVKNHIQNIFKKIGVKNRFQFLAIINEFLNSR